MTGVVVVMIPLYRDRPLFMPLASESAMPNADAASQSTTPYCTARPGSDHFNVVLWYESACIMEGEGNQWCERSVLSAAEPALPPTLWMVP